MKRSMVQKYMALDKWEVDQDILKLTKSSIYSIWASLFLDLPDTQNHHILSVPIILIRINKLSLIKYLV